MSEINSIAAQITRSSGATVIKTGDNSADIRWQRALAAGERVRAGNAVPFETWTALAAASGMLAGDKATVDRSDTGTHTDPVVGGTVPNSGKYVYSASPAGWQRVAELDSKTADTARIRASNAVSFESWTDLAAATEMLVNDKATVSRVDTGTHTDPVVGGTVANSGRYVYQTSPAPGWMWLRELDSKTAETAAATVTSQVLARQVIGPASLVAGSSPISTSASAMNAVAATVAGYVKSVSVTVSAASQQAFLFVATLNGDGTLTRTYLQVVAIPASGINNNIACDMPISVGQYVGIYGVGVTRALSGLTMWSATGLIGTSTAKTITAASGLQLHYEVSPLVLDQAEDGADATAALGTELTIGAASPATSASLTGAGNCYWNYFPFPKAGVVESVRLYNVGGRDEAALLIAVTMNDDGTVNFQRSAPFQILNAGENRITNVNMPVNAGEYVGIQTAARIARISGGMSLFHTGATIPTTNTAKTVLSNDGLQMNVTVSSGVQREVALVQNEFGGLASIVPRINDGIADATADLLRARSANPNPYVGPGSYAVTALKFGGDGLWGPGRIRLNNRRFFIPRAPGFSSLQRQFRAAFSRQIADGSGVVLAGDSMVQCDTVNNVVTAGAWMTLWPQLITDYANILCSPGDIQVVHQFSTGRAPSGTTEMKGITLPASPVFGSRGPTNQSIVLSAGQALTLTGNYAHVDVCYTQEPGAGSLAFAFNGGAAYKTVSCAGTLELDKSTYPSPTGQVVSGTYTITATGGSVEVTAVSRLATVVTGYNKPLRIINCGKNGEMVPLTAYDRMDSWFKQACMFGGTQPAAILEFGANEQDNRLPSAIYSSMCDLIDYMRKIGFTDIYGMGVLRPDPGVYAYPAGMSWEGANGAIRGAYADKGVPVFPLDTLDFYYMDMHPNHITYEGNDLYAQMVVESAARGALSHRQFDGTGSTPYDPASLADGAGVTTTVPVTGAALGNLAFASFSLDLQGVAITAWVSAAGTVSVRFQNETGGTVDLASGTLRAWIVKG